VVKKKSQKLSHAKVGASDKNCIDYRFIDTFFATKNIVEVNGSLQTAPIIDLFQFWRDDYLSTKVLYL
jgi:hypothetical protein